jgi:hypothetical protein
MGYSSDDLLPKGTMEKGKTRKLPSVLSLSHSLTLCVQISPKPVLKSSETLIYLPGSLPDNALPSLPPHLPS